eukprot:CAMPEP_0119406354 /NCGR_PEP_ID=MMETSP1335-20130426/714_1 /TAXON_ID=259385 /ORGANISM="Chrysoculter rhomboideus, Strain RCC1486" /LENGTH=141 /DNA_ID=CAMNT_0007430431 /DNA_START=51 /DNA_END=477 /DNA_ORIENTATION=+
MLVEALDDLDADAALEVLTLFECDFRRLASLVRSHPSVVDALKDPAAQASLQRIKGDAITIGLDEVAKLVDLSIIVPPRMVSWMQSARKSPPASSGSVNGASPVYGRHARQLAHDATLRPQSRRSHESSAFWRVALGDTAL